MYLRESKLKRANGKVVTYLQIAENVWNPEKGRSQARIIYNCGRVSMITIIDVLMFKLFDGYIREGGLRDWDRPPCRLLCW